MFTQNGFWLAAGILSLPIRSFCLIKLCIMTLGDLLYLLLFIMIAMSIFDKNNVCCSVHAYIVFNTEQSAEASLTHYMAVVCLCYVAFLTVANQTWF